MSITEENITEITKIIEQLFNHLLLSEIPKLAPYQGYLLIEQPFALDEDGYFIYFQNLRKSLMLLDDIGNRWSDEALNEKIHNLLIYLADNKSRNVDPSFEESARRIVQELNIAFIRHDCYVPVNGLIVEKRLQIGDVTLLPLQEKPFSVDGIFTLHLNDFSVERDCLAFTTVEAEPQKSAELAREKIEKALNVLRFFGSLVWWDRPVGHIYLNGKELGRVSYSIVIESGTENIIGTMGHTESTPVPFKIDDEFLQFAEFYGFEYIKSLFDQTVLHTEIENDLLAAIQWFGHAVQELEPLVSFVKFYIAIETALKKKKENAGEFLPKRISVLIEPRNKARQEELETRIAELIKERNFVFHAGRPTKFSPEYLSSTGLIFARQILHHLRLRITSDNIQTKDDLISWVQTQSDRLVKK